MIEISSASDIDPSAATTVLWADSRSLDTSTPRQCHSADSTTVAVNDALRSARKPIGDRRHQPRRATGSPGQGWLTAWVGAV